MVFWSMGENVVLVRNNSDGSEEECCDEDVRIRTIVLDCQSKLASCLSR